MAARGLVHSNVTIVAIKDALNGLINEKAHQLIAQYSRILKVTEILDYKILTDQLIAHARRHLDQHYSEGCHQLAINEQRELAGATSPGVHLQSDYQKMLHWVEPQIRILAAELEKAASPQPFSAVARSESVSSHGQSGGITAHTVNIASASPSPPSERPRSEWKKAVAVVVAVVAFIASVVKVLDYFDVKPTSELKAEKKAESRNDTSTAVNLHYPEHGRHGPNILSNSTHEVFTQEGVSMRAEIPARSKLQVRIKMDLPDQTKFGWFYDTSKISNWVNRGYEQPTGTGRATQLFDAEPGSADIEVRFQQTGNLQIEVYEGEAQSPSWSRTVHIRNRVQEK